MAPRFAAYAVLAAAFAGRFLYDRATTLGAFRTVETSFGASGLRSDIKVIPGTIECEDLHLHEDSGLIFAACQGTPGTRTKWFPPLGIFDEPEAAVSGDGNLVVIDPTTFTARRLHLENFSGGFCTHGIDVLPDPLLPNAVFIHAVNHLPNPAYEASRDPAEPEKARSQIEIFHHTLGSKIARHVRSVRHPLIRTPNDIVATGPLSFYVTNDHFYREGVLRIVETLGSKTLTGWTDTVYVSATEGKDGNLGVAAKLALAGMHNNNGLGHAPEGHLLISDASGGIVYLARRRDDNQLNLIGDLKFSTGIDNPSWFADPWPEHDHNASGVVNAGLQRGIDLDNAIKNGGAIPSIVWLSTGAAGQTSEWNTTRLIADDGSSLRSASAAVLVGIDPAANGGKKQAWLFASGFVSAAAIAVKVDI